MKKLILIGFLFTTNQVLADAAKVLYTQNKVTASHNGSVRTLSRGATLDAGDQITTGAGAAIHLQYTNGTLINLGDNSTYKILAYSPKADVQINAELSHGKLEVQNPGKIKETLKTPIVSLAILGTHINVYVPSDKMTYIQVIEGLILARNEYLHAGDSVRVTADRIVNAPFPQEGLVDSPSDSPGKIEDSESVVGLDSSYGGIYGAQVVTYIATNLNLGVSTTSGIQAITGVTTLADISLICNTPTS
jgi:hypothetical protein